MPLTRPNFSPCSEADPEERLDPGGSSGVRFSRHAGCRNVTVRPPPLSWKSHPQPPEGAVCEPPAFRRFSCRVSLHLPRRPFSVGRFRLLCPSVEAAIYEKCFFVFWFFSGTTIFKDWCVPLGDEKKNSVEKLFCFFKIYLNMYFNPKGFFSFLLWCPFFLQC